MMGIKNRNFKTHTAINLEDLVPKDNFYRQLEAKIDLSFVRDLVADYYTPYGRPSIDPVVFFKLQLIMLFEDIRSERLLLKQAHLHLACVGIWVMIWMSVCPIIVSSPKSVNDMD